MRLSSKSITILLLGLLPLLYFYPVVLGQITLLPGDGWLQNLGVRLFIGERLRRGELALWNPLIFGGMPLLASVYPGALYPPNWLFAVFGPKLAANLAVLTTYHIALIGTYLFARRSGSTRLGALVAGVAFSFGGFMINHISQMSRIAAAAWLPWVLLALAGCAAAVAKGSWRRTWLWLALGAAFIALQFFAGEPQMLVFTALVCAFYCLFALGQLGEWRQRAQFLAACLALVLIGVLFSQMQLQPSLELLATSERNDPGALFFAGYSYPPWQLPALIFPYFFGGAFFEPYHTEYWGREIPGIMCGYVGLLTWLLAFAALANVRRDGRVRLWLVVALVAVVLSFGGYLPFGLNELLYRVPGYKTFRGLYRHQYELTFALGMLAALGATRLAELESAARRKLAGWAIAAGSLLILVVAMLFRFFAAKLASTPLPAGATSLLNPEALVPLIAFSLSALALWYYAANQSAIRFNPNWPQSAIKRSAILLVLLLADLAAYGHFFHWKTGRFDVAQRLADPPAVQAIKQREPNLTSFRLAHLMLLPFDYTANWPDDATFDQLNYPNTAMARGLQCVSGYDILRPVRIGEMTGTANSAIAGFLQESGTYLPADRGLDLLNVKYLMVGQGSGTLPDGKETGTRFDGVYFARTNWNLALKPDMSLMTDAAGATANELAVVSTLTNSTHLPDGTPLVKLKLHTRDGRVIERELQAGRDSSEWAYDRADVRASIQHQRARIFASTPAEGFEAHQYFTRIPFERAEIERIEWTYARPDASIVLLRVSLHDSVTGKSSPVPAYSLPPERWRKLGQFEQIELYENLQLLPRAWFAAQTQALPKAQVLAAIRSSKLPDGAAFDPARLALFVVEDFGGGEVKLPRVAEPVNARAEVTRYEPQRITLATRNDQAGLLVLSEMYDRGWYALVDGQKTPVFRVDYNLRGIAVPAGAHTVEFVYRAPAFRQGVNYAAAGLVLLLVGGAIIWRRTAS
jgi:hypothetical protein